MKDLGLVWIVPSCISDLSAAATALKRERPHEFGGLGVSIQPFGLFVFAYSHVPMSVPQPYL